VALDFDFELDLHSATGPSWHEVVAEIVTSCRRRAPRGGLLDIPGAVGVLSGAAPVVWAFGDAEADEVVGAVAASDVDEIYVQERQAALADRLDRNGWSADGRMTQVARTIATTHDDDVDERVRDLRSADLPVVRRALVAWAGCDERVIAASYPDTFFTDAAPVSLMGVSTDDGEIVGIVGVRRQVLSSMLFALAVHPEHRHSRLARLLVESAVRQAHLQGSRFVHAQATGAGAGVLRACGFTPVGTWRRLVRAA